MGAVSGLSRNVKKDLRVRSDCLAKFQRHNIRTRGEERKAIIDRSRKEEHYHQLETMLGCCVVPPSSSSTPSLSESTMSAEADTTHLVEQLTVLVAMLPVDGSHPLVSRVCKRLDTLQCDLRAVDDAPLPNSILKGLDMLIKAGVFRVLDALLRHGPLAAHVALEVEEVLHQHSPPFSVLPHRTTRFGVMSDFVSAVVRSSDGESGARELWGLDVTSANDNCWGGALTPAYERDAFLLAGSSVILALLDDTARCCEACKNSSFFELLSSLFAWRPTVSARLLSKVCRCADSVGSLYRALPMQLMQASTQFISFFRRAAAALQQHHHFSSSHSSISSSRPADILDHVDVVYYGYVCLNALVPHADWEQLKAVVSGELPHLLELGVASNWESGLMGQLLTMLRDFSDVVRQSAHTVLPFLQSLFKHRSSLRDSVLDVFAASPGLFLQDDDFLCNELFPHYRARGVSRVRLLDTLAAVCHDYRDKVVALLDNEHEMGWITVLPSDELSDVEHEKLEILMECLGLGCQEFWSEASSPTWRDETTPTTNSQLQFNF